MNKTEKDQHKDNRVGKIFICGAGPGDPKLLTVRAMELINESDVILYDRLIGKDIVKLFPESTEKVYVGRNIGDPTSHQNKTNELMLHYAKNGKKVLRLKGGDPFIFGRGGEEAEFLKSNNISFEIIPGITSGIGAAIYSGIPLTHRKFSSAVVFVTGHEDPEKKTPEVRWEKLFDAVDTVVIYMGTEKLDIIIEKIRKGTNNGNKKIAVIENSTLKNQRVIKGELHNIIEKVKQEGIRPPAIIIIGDTVELHDKIGWYPIP
ncbi:MAG: uroporphyrinogen-III C-methyltransferase [Candidatus Nitrosocosmicus sp.]